MNVAVRAATPDDVPFMDALQKLHAKQVGWMPRKQLEGKVAAGQVLLAESDEGAERRSDEGTSEGTPSAFPSVAPSLRPSVAPAPAGYCIASDRYFKRDDVGIIYQMNVVPGRQRGLIGATLLNAVFERAAYGCRLFCCWCAQDIAANHFWQAMGFVPLAFRAGSEKKARVHIFWQKRIRSDDVTTPWWFPAKTDAGAMREDRLVLPIPPGTHWSDVKPILLPGMGESAELNVPSSEAKTGRPEALPRPRRSTQHPAPSTQHSAKRPVRRSITATSQLWFEAPAPAAAPVPAVVEKPPREKKAKVKADPRLIAAARELRDRYLEQLNRDGGGRIEIEAKYDVGRRQRGGHAGHVADARATPLLIDARAA